MTISGTVSDALRIAVCAASIHGRRRPDIDSFAIYKSWSIWAVDDGLGAIGMALNLLRSAQPEQALKCLQSVRPDQQRFGLVTSLQKELFDGVSTAPRPQGPAHLGGV